MKRKEKEKQRVCKTVLTFDRYSSKKGKLLSSCNGYCVIVTLKLCLPGNTNVAKRVDDEFDSRIFFKESYTFRVT